MSDQNALFWLLDVEAYDFDIGVLKNTELTGKLMMVSRQLWSVIRGTKVVSILIGPGIFKGVAESGPRKIEILEHLSALIFDPSELRYDEPIPLVDIVNPEIIDPQQAAQVEEIYAEIRSLMIEKGNVLAVDPLIKVRRETSVPQTAHYAERIAKIKISHVSGVQRAKFILGGTHGPLYRPFIEYYNKRRYNNPIYTKVMAIDAALFSPFEDNETTKDWQIVEKYGISNKTGVAAFEEEYEIALSIIQRNSESFIFEK